MNRMERKLEDILSICTQTPIADASLSSMLVPCLLKGSPDLAFAILSILSSESIRLLPPNDEPPIEICIMPPPVLMKFQEALKKLSIYGFPNPSIERITITTGEEGEKKLETKTIESLILIILKGRTTGELYPVLALTESPNSYIFYILPSDFLKTIDLSYCGALTQ